FLAAASLAPDGHARVRHPLRLVLKRYRRLALPLVVAVLLTVLVAALVRPWLAHDSVPDAPTLWQLLAHLFLLQDLVGEEALSAGIWYVAIDLQLFAMTVALLALVRGPRHRWLVLALALASLLVFNRESELDVSGLYFFGAYALGMLAWWGARSKQPLHWLLLITVLAAAALLLEFRGRLLVAALVAGCLVWLQRSPWAARWLVQDWMAWWGRVSYSVFLIHFAVCLLVTALVSNWWPDELAANALGMVAAFGLSVLAGAAMYRWVEAPDARWRTLVGPLVGRVAA
ncbi:MAG: acyltransferase, partial [Comamonadaceae bacterium]